MGRTAGRDGGDGENSFGEAGTSSTSAPRDPEPPLFYYSCSSLISKPSSFSKDIVVKPFSRSSVVVERKNFLINFNLEKPLSPLATLIGRVSNSLKTITRFGAKSSPEAFIELSISELLQTASKASYIPCKELLPASGNRSNKRRDREEYLATTEGKRSERGRRE
ncbi:hypothetical protein TNCV_3454371 [Trichonephila clavipes]|nr:hypothetical protein TNCV_3454371 [Trichonephila clavipes]